MRKKILFGIIFLGLTHFTELMAQPSMKDFNYNSCSNQMTFYTMYGKQRNVGGLCDDYQDEIRSGSIYLIVNGTEHRIARINYSGSSSTMAGYNKSFKSYGDGDNWVFFDEEYSWVSVTKRGTNTHSDDCTAQSGTRYEHFVDITVNIPEQYSGEGQSLRLKFEGNWDGDSNFSYESDNQTAPNIPRVSLPLELESLCGGVELSWSKPSFSCSNASFVVYRDGVQKKVLNFNTQSWIDTSVDFDGAKDYKYEVLVRLNSNEPDDGLTTSVEGNPLKQFDSSDYFESVSMTTTNACEQTVRLEWEVDSEVDIHHFIVERDVTDQFLDPIKETITQTFGPFSFEDTGLAHNQDFYYRIKAFDNCDNETYIKDSDIQHVMFEGRQSKPIITKITTATDGSDQALIQWTYEGTSVEYFEVRRDGLDRSGQLEGDTSFVDEGLSNCIEYEYTVVAIKNCFEENKSQIKAHLVSFNTDLNGFDSFSASKNYYNDRVTLRWEVSASNGANEIVVYRKREGSEDNPEIIKRLDINSSIFSDYDTEPGVLYQYGVLAISCEDYKPSKEEVAMMVTDVGVRSETGIINGKITYQGGNAVPNARVLAAPSDGENRGVSLNMTGNQMTIPLMQDGSNWFPEQWTLSFWVRLNQQTGSNSILEVADGADYLKIGSNPVGQTEFYEIDYKEESTIVGVEDDLVGYQSADGEILSLYDQTILGRVSGSDFMIYDKEEIVANASGDTLYDFTSKEPWLLQQGQQWFELNEESATVAVADSLIGYLHGDSVYEAYDSDFVLAFVDQDKLWLANHYNISFQLGANYAHIRDNQMIFADDTTVVADIVDDIVYSAAGDAIHMIVGNNVFYVYKDDLNGKLVKGKRFARKVPNDTDPNINFDVILLEKTITEEVKKGELLGVVSTDRSKVFDSEGSGINYLIDDDVLRTAVYENQEIYVPDATASFEIEGHSLVSVLSGLEEYLFNAGMDTLYSINLNQGVVDATGFVTDQGSGEYLYYLGDLVGDERQVFKAVGETVQYIVQDTVGTYLKETYRTSLWVDAGDLSGQQELVTPDLYMGEFNNMLLTYDGSDLILFVNGESVDTVQVSGLSSLFQVEDQSIRFGAYDGILDEVLLWDIAKDSLEVDQDFNRYLSGGESGLIGYWRLDEKVSANAFDVSFEEVNDTKNFHGHHATLSSAQWTNIVPEQEDLSFTAFTDEDGNYSIQSIIYSGSGNNFKLVPMLGTHGFEPSNKVLFVGPSQRILNDKDFVDNSSFKVTGTVKYDPKILGYETSEDPNAPNCYVEGVDIYIDNQPIVEGTSFVSTDSEGRFEVDVPIGKHQIKVVKSNHTFVDETWPPEGEYDFQDGVFDLVFYDNTTRSLIGKVVGGSTEGDKESGTAESINNLGVTEIQLKSIGKSCFETVVTTDSITGEYQVDLPPFRYNVVDLRVPSQTTNFNRELKRLAESSIDLSVEDMVLDTVACTGATCTSDSAYFHLKRDFVYRNPAEFTVKQYVESTNEDGEIEYAEILNTLGAKDHTVLVQEANGDTTEVKFDLTSNSPFDYDVFTIGNYIWGITLSEPYENRDANFLDASEPVVYYYDTIQSGTILIDNEVAEESVELSLSNGEVIYSFNSGEPSLLVDRDYPDRSFTKTVQISGPTSNWREKNDLYRAIVLGNVLDNTQRSFYTVSEVADYQIIDMVLRDPPGSQSFSEFAQNTKITKVRNTTLQTGAEQKSHVYFGGAKEVSTGVGVETKIVSTKNYAGLDDKTTNGRKATETSVLTFEEKIKYATSSENANTGAGSDIFVGNALNVYYTPSYDLSIIEVSDCGGENECLGETFTFNSMEFAFARSKSISLGMEEHTLFYYTQRQLEQLIQDMEEDLPSISDQSQKTRLENQARIWKSAIAQNEYEKLVAKKIAEDGVSATEAEDGWKMENISFAYGSKVDRSYALDVKNKIEISKQFSYYVGTNVHIEFSLGPVYFNSNMEIGQTVYADDVESAESDESKSISVHLQDNDPGDQYSVDMILSGAYVHNETDIRAEMTELYERFNNNPGYMGDNDLVEHVDNNYEYQATEYINPIFITKGGRTSCPYEPQESARYLEYLDPTSLADLENLGFINGFAFDSDSYTSTIDYSSNQDKMILNYGTFQRDQPGFRIEPRVQRGIPWDLNNRATFDIILENKNLEDTVRTYNLVVDQRTTGAGPTMRLDGERFIKGTPIALYGGEQLTKSITLRPVEGVYDYEDIVVYLVAGCQFDFGQDLDFQEDIFARDTLSVFFDPACPKATSIAPTEGWIVNNQTGSAVSVEIQEQSYYFANHDKVKLQFKATYQSDEDWVDAAVWSRDEEEVLEQVALGENYFDFPEDNNYITYDWDVDEYDLPDGNYHIRWEYHCTNGLESYSAPINGLIDRTSPHAFGRPAPADGVLSPEDEIILTLNEPIEAGLVDRDFITVRGKINGTELTHPVSVRFSDSESDQVVIPNIQLKNVPITAEMWVKRSEAVATREQELFYHGEPGATELSLRLLDNGKLQLSLNDQVLVSDAPVSLDSWSHVAFAIDPNSNKGAIYHNATLVAFSETFIALHFANSPIVLGGEGATSFTGNVHEFRLWNDYKGVGDLAENFYKDLTGREMALVGYWPMNEGRGTLAQDKVQSRNAEVNAGWWASPSSLSFDFTGSNSIELPSVAFAHDEDFTIEFWFKAVGTSASDTMVLVSNGNLPELGWELIINTMGQIVLSSDGEDYVLVGQSVMDETWHHLALVVNRVGNTTTYLDTQVVSTFAAELFGEFGGPAVMLGAGLNYSEEGPIRKEDDQFFHGQMDEFRIWRMVKRAEQIERMANYKLEGDEFGLLCYLPFENYDETLRISEGSLTCFGEFEMDTEGPESNSETYSEENPGIVLKPYETPVNFNYSVSGDKVIITLDEENPAAVENCILDISVRNLIDANGNVMKSPVTWSVFVDRNQVTWQDRVLTFEKQLNEALTFTATLVNSGGEIRDFEIDNLPAWLSASSVSGTINPDSEETIEFTVSKGLNIGEYQQPIHLRTDFGFNESLLLDLKVVAPLPADWTFNPEDFQYSMSFIGQVKIEGYYSIDEEDMVAAFVDGGVRGVAALAYQEVYDNYQAFLSVYSNSPALGEELEFRIWDASEGKILSGIEVSEIENPVIFAQNEIYGLPSSPVTFESKNEVMTTMSIPKGWKWVSFNLDSDDLQRTSSLFEGQELADGDRLLSMDAVDVYDAENKLWIGTLAGDNLPPTSGGIEVKQAYRVYSSQAFQIQYSGKPVETLENTIWVYSEGSSIKPRMWNWVGYLGQENMDINEALASLQPAEGDIIKSQYAFAIYDPVLKWIGNLEFLKPGEGYLMKVASDQQLTFPSSGLINASSRTNSATRLYEEGLNPHLYRDNMNMVVSVVGLDLNQEAPLLEVYAGSELRGVAQAKEQEDGQQIYYLTIYGNDYEDLSFSLKFDDYDYAIDEQGYSFQAAAVMGDTQNPVTMNYDHKEDVNLGSQVFPNPFDQTVKFVFQLDQSGFTQLRVWSLDGKILIDREFIGDEGETISFEWNGVDDYGSTVKPGVYLTHIQSANHRKEQLLIKK